MPTYEFECISCGHRHEVIMKMSEIQDYGRVCKNEVTKNSRGTFPCGGQLTQVYDNRPELAIHFKGTGWTPKFGPVNRG